MSRTLFRRLALFALCGALVQPAVYAQDEKKSDAKSEEATKVERTVTVRLGTGKHWIGVLAVPIDESLKAQLNLKDRLIVHHVLPESPAGKAGLQTHDILLKYGDKEVTKLQDLVGAVSESKGAESKLTVLRAGKEVTLSVTPGERPAEDHLNVLLPKEHQGVLERWLPEVKGEGAGSIRIHGFGPGVMTGNVFKQSEFPKGLSITVSKEDDKPATIVAKKEGKTYETTADKLDILPEEIRGHVQRLLHGQQVMAWAPSGDGAIRYHLNAERVKEMQKAAEAARGDAAKALRQHIEVRKVEGGELSELKKELEALRKDVQSLKGEKAQKTESKENESDKNEKSDN